LIFADKTNGGFLTLKKVLIEFIRSFALKLNIAIVKKSTLDLITSRIIHLEPFERWASPSVSPDLRDWVFLNIKKSRAQLQQDLFVSYFFPEFDSEKFFVEFGATNGISLSNTYLLEKELGWGGIVAEPGRVWHKELARNRECKVEFDCVYSSTGQVIQFSEVDIPELSTISSYQEGDSHSESRKRNARYSVSTVSLEDLLLRNNSPRAITYLSIDTEGSEYDILKGFPFWNWEISIISVEHNYTESREKLDILLKQNGFKRVLEEVSQFDSWYLSEKVYNRLLISSEN
jgi:FkbM family methyltransferase